MIDRRYALQQQIESGYKELQALSTNSCPTDLKVAIEQTLQGLNDGEWRVAERQPQGWVVHDWLKKAILLYFRTHANQWLQGEHQYYHDKVPLRHAHPEHCDPSVRLVPHATARWGSYIGPQCVLMPSYVNIGAHIGRGCMIDTWSTVGSCAQIGQHVHLSGGAGIGGVLEPLQAQPTIIEDHCFIGARSEIVEGVIVEAGCVIGMGVTIGQSTRIYERETGTIYQGRVPAGSVVIAGSLPSSIGDCHLQCAVIVKRVDAQTRAKTSVNELLREASNAS